METTSVLTQILTLLDNAVANGYDYFAMVGKGKKQPKTVASHTLDFDTQVLTITYNNGSTASAKVKPERFDKGILTTKEFIQATYNKPQYTSEQKRAKNVTDPLAYLYTELTLGAAKPNATATGNTK